MRWNNMIVILCDVFRGFIPITGNVVLCRVHQSELSTNHKDKRSQCVLWARADGFKRRVSVSKRDDWRPGVGNRIRGVQGEVSDNGEVWLIRDEKTD